MYSTIFKRNVCCFKIGFEIPDADAERLLRPVDVVKYVSEKLAALSETAS